MANRELALALRIRALVEGGGDVDNLRDAVEDLIRQSGVSIGDPTTNLREGMQGTADAAKALAETEEQAAARIRDMVQASVEAQRANSASAAAADANAAAVREANAATDHAAQSTSAAGRSLNKLASEYSGLASVQASATAENVKADRASATYLTRLQSQYDVLGKNRSELEAMRAKQAGMTIEVQRAAAAIGAKIDAWQRDEQAARAAAKAEEQVARAAALSNAATGKAGLSAGQLRQGLQQLPMQFTDIFTSLAGGQSPMLVLIQQGGQIRDSFGGILPALRAVGSLINPVTVGIGLAAGAIALLGKAFLDGTVEARRFNTSIETTGNFAGATSERIELLAANASQISGISSGAAREAATAMVQSGRLGIDTIANLTTSIETYAAVTGQSTSQAASSLTQMFEKPTDAAYRLNQQFHFLTLAQFQYISTLEKQGNTEAAQLELSKRLSDHMGTTMAKSLTGVEKLWKSIASAASDAWLQMSKAVSGTRTNVDKLGLKELELRDLDSQTGPASKSPVVAKYRAQLVAEIDALKAGIAAEAKAAGEDSLAAATEQRKINADRSFNARVESLRNWREKLNEEIKKIRDEGVLLGKTQKDIDDQIARATERAQPKTSTRTNPAESAFSQQRLSLAKAIAAENQKIANLDAGMKQGENRQVASLEEWLKYSKEGSKLLPGQVQQLREMAAQADQLTAALNKRSEQQEIDKRLPKEIADLNAQLLAATGQQADATAEKISARFKQLREDVAKTTDPSIDKDAVLTRIVRLEGIQQAKAQIEDLQRQVDQAFGDQARGESAITLQVKTGLISEVEGRKQTVALYQKTADIVSVLIPDMQRLAETSGDPRIVTNVANLTTKVAELRSVSNEAADALGKAFQGSFGNTLEALATRTKTLGEAVQDMIRDIAASMARWAAEQLASEARVGLLNLGKSLLPGAAAAGAVASTGADAAGSAAVAASGTAAATAMSGTAAAATALTAALSQASIAAGGQVASGAASSGGSWISAIGSFFGFADGGYTGEGTKYQPAGIVHAGEHVTRSEVVKQPGALSFLDQFNRYGMSALYGLRGYAVGGLVGAAGVSMPALPGAGVSEAAGGRNGPVTLNQRVVGMLDPDMISDALRGPRGEHLLEVLFTRNPSKFKNILKA